MKAVFLILMAIVVISPAFGQSESDFRVSVDLSGNGVVIDKYLGTARIVVIPSTIQGYPVREIGEEAFFLTRVRITSVTIPEGVTRIGRIAFAGCWDLTTIIFPSTLRYIGEGAFEYCRSLPLATQTQLRRLGYTGNF